MAKKTATKAQTAESVFSQMREILRDAWGFAWKWKWFYLAAFAILTPLVILIMRHDAALLPHFRFADSPSASKFAKFMQTIGETTGTTLVLYVTMFAIGLWFKKKKLARVALAMMLAVVVSGVGLYMVRVSFGRARPCVKENPGRFEWFEINSYYNSFPSAHCAEAWTLTTVLSAAYPPVAVPACAYAGTMMWARMQRNQHFPSDVVAGSLWGVMFSLPFAVVALGKKPRRDKDRPL